MEGSARFRLLAEITVGREPSWSTMPDPIWTNPAFWLGVWGAGLSTAHALISFLRYRGEGEPDIAVSLEETDEPVKVTNQDTGEFEFMDRDYLEMNARNPGTETVVIEEAWLEYPSGHQREVTPFPTSSTSLPYRLEPKGRRWDVKIDPTDIVEDLQEIAGRAKIVPCCEDGGGNVHKGDPIVFDTDTGKVEPASLIRRLLSESEHV